MASIFNESKVATSWAAVLMYSPAVSIISPYRDAKGFLSDFVTSLKSQTFQDWECILVDHGSMDSGPDLALFLTADDLRFKHVSMKRPCGQGRDSPAAPRNQGLRHAQAQLIAFLDVDDLWHPLRLERQLDFHVENRLDVSVSGYACFDDVTGLASCWRCPPLGSISEVIWRKNPVPMLSVLVNRDLVTNGFPLVHHEDYLMWLTVFGRNPHLRYGCLPEILAFYRKHASNLSRQPLDVARWTYGVYREAKCSQLTSLGLLLRWGFGHLMRSLLERHPDRRLNCAVSKLLAVEPVSLVNLERLA